MGENKELVKVSGGLSLQNQLLAELDTSAKNMGQDFTEYGKKCVVNAIASLVIYTKQNNVSLNDFDPTLVRLALQNIGYTELNIAAIPSECYLDIRKTKDGKRTLSIKPQGAGNEKLLRTYGVNVKEVKPAWLVREGDEFVYPSYDGLNMIPPKWTPKSYDKKVVMVVYPVIKLDGSVEYLIATREGIKPNIIAQVRQNALYDKDKDKIYADIEKDAESKSVDELLKEERWAKIINPTYTSGGSKEQMILRKMCNNALKNYPKEYRDSYMADAVKNMFEDQDESVIKKDAIDQDVVEKVEGEINEEPKGDAIPDFNPEDEGIVEEVKKPDPTNIPTPDDFGGYEDPFDDKVEEQPKPAKKDYGF